MGELIEKNEKSALIQRFYFVCPLFCANEIVRWN